MISRLRAAGLPIVLYPIATPVAAIVHLWAVAVVHPGLLIRPVLVAILVCLLFIVVSTLVAGDRHRAGLAAWAFAVGLTVDDIRASALLAVVGVAILAASVFQRDRRWERGPLITQAMNALGAILIVASIIRAIQAGAIQAAVEDVRLDLGRTGPAAEARPGAPDIYVMLIDGYPGSIAASSEPSFDANAFPSALRDRGFEIAAHSRSNYLITRLTLPSVFTFSQLPDIPGLRAGTIAEDGNTLRLLTDGGAVLRMLGEAGYERIGVASGYSDLGPNRLDRQIVPPEIEEFEAAVLRTIGAGEVLDVVVPDLGPSQKRQRVLDTYSALAAIAAEPHSRPRFVFVHVPGPHAPWVSAADGSPVPGASRLGAFNDPLRDIPAGRHQFFGYATYIAGQTIKGIDAIRAGSSKSPVIALFSDHGPDVEFDSHDPLSSDLNERTSNFMAVLAPGKEHILPDDATPVNLFPVIFNAYLGTDLPMQPNTMWAWKKQSSILDYVQLDPVTFKAKH